MSSSSPHARPAHALARALRAAFEHPGVRDLGRAGAVRTSLPGRGRGRRAGILTLLVLFGPWTGTAADGGPESPATSGNRALAESRFVLRPDPPVSLPALIVLEIVEGNDCEGLVGHCVEAPVASGGGSAPRPQPLTVRAVDRRSADQPVPGLDLRFSGPGIVVEVTGLTTITDGAGLAGVRYLLSQDPGVEAVVVSAVGAPEVEEIRIRERAILPEVETNLASLDGRTVQVGSGEAFVRVRVFRRGTPARARVGVETQVALDGRSEDGARDAEASGLYISPRQGRTDARGERNFALVPDEEGDWRLTLSLPEFAQIPPIEVTLRARAVAAAGVPGRIPSVITGQGQIVTHDHPATFSVDPGPLAAAVPQAVRWVGEGFHVESTSVRATSAPHPSGRPVYEFLDAATRTWISELVFTIPAGATGQFAARPAKDMLGALPHPIQVEFVLNLRRGDETRTVPVQ